MYIFSLLLCVTGWVCRSCEKQQWVLLTKPQTRPWECRREHGVPNQTDRMAVTFCDCHPHGTRGIHHRISKGQFWMPSIVSHYWWHLAAPRISHSEEWELIPIYPWPQSPLQVWLRSSLTCNENLWLPNSSVRPFVDWDSCCDLRALAQARYFQSTELFIWHLSVLTVGNWGTCQCSWDSNVLDLSQNLFTYTCSLFFKKSFSVEKMRLKGDIFLIYIVWP